MNWRLIRWAIAGLAVVTEVAAFAVWRRRTRRATTTIEPAAA